MCNFTPNRYDDFVIGLPQRGTLHEILSSDEERFGGSGLRNAPVLYTHREGFLDMPCSAKITVPPMSCLYFRYKIRKSRKH